MSRTPPSSSAWNSVTVCAQTPLAYSGPRSSRVRTTSGAHLSAFAWGRASTLDLPRAASSLSLRAWQLASMTSKFSNRAGVSTSPELTRSPGAAGCHRGATSGLARLEAGRAAAAARAVSLTSDTAVIFFGRWTQYQNAHTRNRTSEGEVTSSSRFSRFGLLENLSTGFWTANTESDKK